MEDEDNEDDEKDENDDEDEEMDVTEVPAESDYYKYVLLCAAFRTDNWTNQKTVHWSL